MDTQALINSIGSWLSTHGLAILLILLAAKLIRHSGMLFLKKFIQHSVETSPQFESKRDKKLRADTLISLADSILKITVYVVALLLILAELNALQALAPLLAGAGILSLLLGFGIQTFVKDFVSGVFIVGENQYRVGDVVALTTSAGGVEGTVIQITLRTTVLRDDEGSIHFIPNGNVLRTANLTLDYAKVNVEIALPLHSDLDTVAQQIGELGIAMSKEDAWEKSIVQAPYYHGVKSFDKESVTIEVRAKTIPAEQWRFSSELRKRLAQLAESKKYFEEKKSKTK